MRDWAWVLIGIAAAFGGGPAAGQSLPGTEQAPIVVEGRRDRDTEIRELVDALPPAPANGHISRFEHEACPAVLGVPPAQRALVATRMRAVGAAAGVPVGRANCRPNVLVMITSDKRQLIEQLARRYPYYFGDLSSRGISRLAGSAEPAVMWHLNGTVDADGRQRFATGGYPILQRTTRAGSRITDQAHAEFIGSVLVVEASALAGLTTTQLADYAAMRTYSGVDPARLPDRSLATVLTLLDAPMGSEVPVTLTHWDLALLESLYASNASTYAPAQRGEIQDAMRRQVARTADRRDGD